MKEKAPWLFLVALLVVDLILLVQRRNLENGIEEVRAKSAVDRLHAEYADEEEALLTGTRNLPAAFPRLRPANPANDTVQFVLVAGVGNCTNGIEDEVARLNQLALLGSARIDGVQGFFVDEGQRPKVSALVAHMSPAPVFPISVRNVISHLKGATTPLVLVVRSRDGRILDAHKPVPEDLTKRDAFYARWTATLGLS